MRRITIATVTVLATLVAGVGPALACGGLIAANGSVQLLRTSTLVGYVDGVEHYVTNFDFASAEDSFGSIVPLPAEPSVVERAGGWTLQRLDQEVNDFGEALTVAADADGAGQSSAVEVLSEHRIDSLDVTIVKGGGSDVAAWAAAQGFELSEDAPAMLDDYADRSPYFMAARFDADAAVKDDFQSGDGVPVHLAIPTETPWVPLQILGLGKADDDVVDADVFLLTPDRPALLGDDALTLGRSEPATDLLLDDLRSDENSAWIPHDAWFTHLAVDSSAGDLDTDLAVSLDGPPSTVDAGIELTADPLIGGVTSGRARGAPFDATTGAGWPWRTLGAALGAIAVTGTVSLAMMLRRLRRR